jgi:hypothetical protein
MKFLIIQENGRHDKNRNFRECFCLQRALEKLQHSCRVWGLGHFGFEILPDFNSFDVIIDLENYDDRNWLPDLSDVEAYKVIWNIDEHSRGSEYYQERFIRNRCQLMLHSTRTYVKAKTDLWFPNCFDNTLVGPRQVGKKADIGFCGNIVNRGVYLNYLAYNFNFRQDIFVIGEDMVQAINSYKIHFNKNIADDVNYRNFETIGCGVVLLTNHNYQYKELGFIDGSNCLIYSHFDELSSKITGVLEHQDLLDKIAAGGYELSKKHTYEVRAGYLLDFLKHHL